VSSGSTLAFIEHFGYTTATLLERIAAMKKSLLLLGTIAICFIALLHVELTAQDIIKLREEKLSENQLAAQALMEAAQKAQENPQVKGARIVDIRMHILEEKLSEKNRATVQERMEAVQKELETLKDHAWAGSYSTNGVLTFDQLLVVAPKSGFAYTHRSNDIVTAREVNGEWVSEYSLGDQNYGEAIWEEGCLKLSPSLSLVSYTPLSKEFVPIRWDYLVYLVPADGIIDFCNTVNRGNGDSSYIGRGTFFLRDAGKIWQDAMQKVQAGEERPKPTGKPEVPEKFKAYLLEKPIDGEVIAVGETREVSERKYGMDWKSKKSTVTINKGSRDGLLPGMELHQTQRTEKSSRLFTVKLTKIAETESEGIVETNLDEAIPQVGWSVSTCVRW
jgi:predicted metal-dependent hydrolase